MPSGICLKNPRRIREVALAKNFSLIWTHPTRMCGPFGDAADRRRFGWSAGDSAQVLATPAAAN